MQLINFKNLFWKFLKKLSNLNFAILMLFVIIFCILIGSIIEQDQNLSFYKEHYPISSNIFYLINWKLIFGLGLDHIYQVWWFFIILFIFSLSLISCTFSVQLPSLSHARRWKFKSKLASNDINIVNTKVKPIFEYDSTSLINIIYSLSYYDYYIFNKDKYIYAYKGILGRIAPVFVHLGIIITLCGSVISVLTSFNIQESIPAGETFHLKNIISYGNYSYINPDIVGHVNNFFIDYYNSNRIKQFFSDIVLLDNKYQKLINHKISVNSPLIFKGITIYQTDWKINAVRLMIDNRFIIQEKLSEINLNQRNCWIANLTISKNRQLVLILFKLKDNIYIYDSTQDIMYPVLLNDTFTFNGINIKIIDIIVSTGLQIKVDSGIWLVYLGFLIIIVSTILSYLSYSQVWVSVSYQSLKIGGSTNRAILFFEEDISKVNFKYQLY
uniref:Cytochrome c biogenesis protein CcsB n=1 Tax=Anotrichium furcellatum TaxID=41999 RepID=A0A4D6WLS0_9FLOR|nr:cytochrome c biogenesis protein ccs1 [Anotrichium furcellatum]